MARAGTLTAQLAGTFSAGVSRSQSRKSQDFDAGISLFFCRLPDLYKSTILGKDELAEIVAGPFGKDIHHKAIVTLIEAKSDARVDQHTDQVLYRAGVPCHLGEPRRVGASKIAHRFGRRSDFALRRGWGRMIDELELFNRVSIASAICS